MNHKESKKLSFKGRFFGLVITPLAAVASAVLFLSFEALESNSEQLFDVLQVEKDIHTARTALARQDQITELFMQNPHLIEKIANIKLDAYDKHINVLQKLSGENVNDVGKFAAVLVQYDHHVLRELDTKLLEALYDGDLEQANQHRDEYVYSREDYDKTFYQMVSAAQRDVEIAKSVFRTNNLESISFIAALFLLGLFISSWVFHHLDRKIIQTHRKLRQQKNLAEEQTKFKSGFLANMSHEIRTPLNGILGLTELMEGTQLSQQQQEWHAIIKRSGENLLQIINNILDLSKIEAGQYGIELVDFMPAEVSRDIVSLMAPIAAKKNIALTFNNKNASHKYHGPQVVFQQVLTNLVANAIKFTSTGRVNITLEVADRKLKLRVEDTGCGIPESRIEDIFKEFTQADSSTTRRYGGTGLGLSICHKMVTLAGGDISVHSIENVGSKFQASFPVGDAKFHMAKNQDRYHKIEIPQLPILVAEDDPTNKIVIRGLLQKLGLNCDIVASGTAAIDAAKKSHYDLIFMDFHMPELDGYEATKKIRQNGYQGVILGLSASVLAEDIKKGHDSGMDGFLSKPVRLDDLRSAVLEKTCFSQVGKSSSPYQAKKAS